jgi:CheY-like chemotaxis protein
VRQAAPLTHFSRAAEVCSDTRRRLAVVRRGFRDVWRDRSVVVVEDDEGIRDVLARALGTELGAYTVVAPDGGEAVKWIGRLEPHVVLLDLGLPTLDGFEVARRVKADPKTKDTCIIAITALTPINEVRDRAIKAGCDDFVAKPFQIDQLLDLVHRRLVEADNRR